MMLEKIFGEEYLRSLGIYYIAGERWFSPWGLQYLGHGHYRFGEHGNYDELYRYDWGVGEES